MKKNICVCFGATSDFEFAVGTSIINFVELHGTDNFDFLVFSDSRLPKLVNVMKRLGIPVTVQKYRPAISWRALWASKAVAYFSPLVLSPFEAFSLLRDYNKVLWLDFDMLLLKPLSDLLDDQKYDFSYHQGNTTIGEAFVRAPEQMNSAAQGVCGGLLSFASSFPKYESVTRKLYEIFLSNASNLYMPEQGVFDIFVNETEFRSRFLPTEIYCAYPGQETSNTLVLHTYGSKKFWNGLHNKLWDGYFRKWLRNGGNKYSPYKSKGKKLIRGMRYLSAQLLSKIIPT
jgi:lipopolysaccharide biosynthesis glycosyltransferase